MQQGDTFAELLEGVRAGDQQAAAKFVRAMEPHIHQAVRFPLRYYRLHNFLDSADISQSVLGDFFRRKLAHRDTLRTQTQCLRLLVRMARCKVMDEVRKNNAACRDYRRLDAHFTQKLSELIDPNGATPSGLAADAELVREAYRRLTDKERTLTELWARGLSWSAIAQLCGTSPESVRKRLRRAMRRVGHELGVGLA